MQNAAMAGFDTAPSLAGVMAKLARADEAYEVVERELRGMAVRQIASVPDPRSCRVLTACTSAWVRRGQLLGQFFATPKRELARNLTFEQRASARSQLSSTSRPSTIGGALARRSAMRDLHHSKLVKKIDPCMVLHWASWPRTPAVLHHATLRRKSAMRSSERPAPARDVQVTAWVPSFMLGGCRRNRWFPCFSEGSSPLAGAVRHPMGPLALALCPKAAAQGSPIRRMAPCPRESQGPR